MEWNCRVFDGTAGGIISEGGEAKLSDRSKSYKKLILNTLTFAIGSFGS